MDGENNKIDKLNKFINDCIKIEKNIENIQNIKESIEKCNSKIIEIYFIPNNEDEIDEFINNIKSFGEIREEINYIKYYIVSSAISKFNPNNLKLYKLKLYIN